MKNAFNKYKFFLVIISGSAFSGCSRKHQKYVGEEVLYIKTVHYFEDCQHFCDRMSTCSTWSHNNNRRERKHVGCHLFAEGAARIPASRSWTSGVKLCLSEEK